MSAAQNQPLGMPPNPPCVGVDESHWAKTFAERAALLTRYGIRVMPLLPRTKKAFLDEWQNLATVDAAQIAEWNKKPKCNCAAVFKNGEYCGLEIDDPTLPDQIETETGHSLEGIDTLVVNSSGERYHYYFKHTESTERLGNVDGDEPDASGRMKELFSFRAHNKYFVGPDSIHPITKKPYRIVAEPVFGDIAEMPEWLTVWLERWQAAHSEGSSATEQASQAAAGDYGFKKLFDAVGYKPLIRRMKARPDVRLHADKLEPGKTVPCPMPQHKHADYTPCFGPLAGAPEMLHCLGNCKFSGDVIKACYELDSGSQKYKTMYDAARQICGEEGLRFEDFFTVNQNPSSESGTSATSEPPPWVEPMREEAFYGLAGEFVRRVEPETEADRHALLANFLVMAGVLFGRNAYAIADGKRHYPNEYVLLVGESGAAGRKGTATERSLPVFQRVNEKFYDHLLNGLSTGEGLIKATEPKDYEEGLSCRSYLVLLSEYASLLGVMKREGNTMSAVLRNAWDTAKLVVLTRKDPLKVDNVNLSLVAHITPTELLNTLEATERANGFANRHLVVTVRRSKLLPEGGNNDIDLNDIVIGLHNAVLASRDRRDWDGRLSRNAEAKAHWAEVYAHLTRTRLGLSGALLSRAEAHVLRLSLLYALLDSAKWVRLEHLKAALAFWDYCEASVGLIFRNSSGDPAGDKILEFMARCPDGFALATDISGGVFHRNKPADWIHAKMDELVRRGKIVPAIHPTAKGELEGWQIIAGRQRVA